MSICDEIPWSEVARELPSWVETDEATSSRSRRCRGMPSPRRHTMELFLSLSLKQKLLHPEEEEEEVEEEEEEMDEGKVLDEEEADLDDMRSHRIWWKRCLGPYHGSFHDNTSLRPMRYTEGTIPRDADSENVLEILSVQVTEAKDGLEWPLHVYGHIAVRDLIDHNCNLLFNRNRDNCQTLTQKDSCLLLTGPARPVIILDQVFFEVDLKVKGKTEQEDNILSLKVFRKRMDDCMIAKRFSSKRCNLEFTFAVLLEAVEATVDSVKVIEGTWPDHLRGQIVSRTASICEKHIVLLDSQDGRMPINCDGKIDLSRDVVSVELSGKLYIGVVASQVDNKTDIVKEDTAVFTPLKATRSLRVCDLGFCKVEITVAWSLFTIMADIADCRKRFLY